MGNLLWACGRKRVKGKWRSFRFDDIIKSRSRARRCGLGRDRERVKLLLLWVPKFPTNSGGGSSTMALHSSFTAVGYANPVSSSRQRQPVHLPYVSNSSILYTRHCRTLRFPCYDVSPSLKATFSPALTVWSGVCFFFFLIGVGLVLDLACSECYQC